MNLEQLFCPNIDCPARGQVCQGNIGSHSQKEKRCFCKECGKSFTVTKGTLFYRLRTDPKTVMCVIVLLANGCPLQAVVKAFGFDERTVKSWWLRAGAHCAAVHNHLIGQSRLDLQQVQADEIKAKVQGGYLWLAMAIMVPTRLWLGGVISPRRDKVLIQALANHIRALALCRPLLLAVDGLPGYTHILGLISPSCKLSNDVCQAAWKLNDALFRVVRVTLTDCVRQLNKRWELSIPLTSNGSMRLFVYAFPG
jgi:transposase-like protein